MRVSETAAKERGLAREGERDAGKAHIVSPRRLEEIAAGVEFVEICERMRFSRSCMA